MKQAGDIPSVRSLRASFGPIQTIIPWASNLYTERLIERKGALRAAVLGLRMLAACGHGSSRPGCRSAGADAGADVQEG